MPYGKKSYRRKRTRRRRRKARRRVPGASKIAKIAKRVYKKLDTSETESYYITKMISAPVLSTQAPGVDLGAIVYNTGMVDRVQQQAMNINFWGPSTRHVVPNPTVAQKGGERMGREIFFKGIQLDCFITLPENCYESTVEMIVCKTKTDSTNFHPVLQVFGNPNDPYELAADNDYRKFYRVVARRKWHLKQKSGRNQVYNYESRRVRTWIPINKRILYKNNPIAPLADAIKEDFIHGYYQVYFRSTTPEWNQAAPIDLDSYPNITGLMRWYYTDK